MQKRYKKPGPKAEDFKLKRTVDFSPVYKHLFTSPNQKTDYKILKPVKKHRNALVHARYGLIFDTEKYLDQEEGRKNSVSASPSPSERSSEAPPEKTPDSQWSRRILQLVPEGVVLPEKTGKWKSLEECTSNKSIIQ